MGPLLIRTSLAGYIATSFIISFGPSHRLAGLKREYDVNIMRGLWRP